MYRFLITLTLLSLGGGIAHTAVVSPSAEIDRLVRSRHIAMLRAEDLTDYLTLRYGIPPQSKSQQRQVLQNYSDVNRKIWPMVSLSESATESVQHCQLALDLGRRLHGELERSAKRTMAKGQVKDRARLYSLYLESLSVEFFERNYLEEGLLCIPAAQHTQFLDLWMERQQLVHRLVIAIEGQPGAAENWNLLNDITEAAPKEIMVDGGKTFVSSALWIVGPFAIARWVFAGTKWVGTAINAGLMVNAGYQLYRYAKQNGGPEPTEENVFQQAEYIIDGDMMLMDYHAHLNGYFTLRGQEAVQRIVEIHHRFIAKETPSGQFIVIDERDAETQLTEICAQIKDYETRIQRLSSETKLAPNPYCL